VADSDLCAQLLLGVQFMNKTQAFALLPLECAECDSTGGGGDGGVRVDA
jgi:hypothetical protein